MTRQVFYQPVARGYEREIAKRLTYWERLRSTKQADNEAGVPVDEN